MTTKVQKRHFNSWSEKAHLDKLAKHLSKLEMELKKQGEDDDSAK